MRAEVGGVEGHTKGLYDFDCEGWKYSHGTAGTFWDRINILL